jgi:hypothetical protein
MSAARDLFLGVGWSPRHGDAAAYRELCQTAELWRRDGQYFSAGIAMSRACDTAWGRPDDMLKAEQQAIADFEQVIKNSPPGSPPALTALLKLGQSLVKASRYFDIDRALAGARVREINSELAQRLVTYFGDDEHADNYLVRGFQVTTRLDRDWTLIFPEYEVPLGTELGGEEYLFNIPSAFHLFIDDRDWRGANQIVEKRSGAFVSAGLRGWRAVTLAHMKPEDAMALFDDAADAFASDAQISGEELEARGGSWSGINQQLWAKYFRARARVAESIRNPHRVEDLLATAANELTGTESGWHSSAVSRFHIIIKVLSALLSDPSSLSGAVARREYEREISMFGRTDEDRLALTFISETAEGFREFASDPASALTRNRLGVAFEALGKVSTIGPSVTEAVRPEIGKSALQMVLGPVRTWMHRSIGSITDEARLRRIILRLLQGGLPRYAQIRHGPLEFGKDIAALLEIDGVVVLRHFQVKCGDIDRRKWRESKDELEEIFLVPLSSPQLPTPPQRTEGVLVTNGHANPYVEPVISGWFQEQRQIHGRQVTFMHLDGLVDWIVESQLVNELRAALQEEGVKVEPAGA